jgi:hypothetical protein
VPPLGPALLVLTALVGAAALLVGLAVLMRGAGARGRRGAIAVLAVGGAGLFLGGTALGVPAVHADGAVGAAATTLVPQRATPTPSALLARTALDALAVKGPAPMTGYRRVGEFGEAWADVDRNGCDTRNDVLRRDLVRTTVVAGCTVRRGVLHDPYTGTTIRFVRGEGTSEAVQIDHVVALADAWRTGAQRLPQERRIALANDPLNLYAVDGPTNTRKSDGDAATWLPPAKAFRCTYVAHQVAVKRAYGLWVTKAEKAAIARVLERCPGQRLPTAAAIPAAAPTVHAGAYCSPVGATGRTEAGTAMRCAPKAAGERARWRSAA